MEGTARARILAQMLAGYQAYFDIRHEERIGGLAFAATAEFHSRSEKYLLTQKAQLWAAENHEYCYFAAMEHLDAALAQRYLAAARADGLARVRPHCEHMYSDICLVLLADTLSDGAAALIAHSDYHKAFLLTLHGWADFRVAALATASGRIWHNKRGKALAARLRQAVQRADESPR